MFLVGGIGLATASKIREESEASYIQQSEVGEFSVTKHNRIQTIEQNTAA